MERGAQIIDQLVQVIVNTVHPLRIILFGSAARGELQKRSDLDVLVIVPDGTDRRKVSHELYSRLFDAPVPVDILVATESDVREYADNWSLVYYHALREGKEIYAAQIRQS